MVMMQRNQIYESRPSNCNYDSQLPMGNDDSGPLSSLSRSDSFFSRWTLSFVYVITVVSWLSAFQFNDNINGLSIEIGLKAEYLNLQKDQTLNLIDDAKNMRDSILRQNRKQQRTKRLFEHEARMSEELYEMKQTKTEKDISEMIEKRRNGIATNWVQQRQEALYHKILNLQSVAQSQSRKQVMKKYGAGPHRVQFDVLTGQNARTPGSFIVDLAPIDLVPHSVEVFLDMITKHLWDNTVFHHHSSQHHVVAAAPVNYGTFDTKIHHFEALGYSGLSFPEYSDSFPHTTYTLGFAGTGPHFYINTIDNSKYHGLGSQGHHDLPSDGDPCFGRIIHGQEVVMQLMPERSKSPTPKTWADFDVSRIVRIKLL